MGFLSDVGGALSSFGKKAYGVVKRIGKGIKEYGPQIVDIAGKVGGGLKDVAPFLSALPEVGPALSSAALGAGSILSTGAGKGRRLLKSSENPLDFANEIYGQIKGVAAGSGGMINGSQDINGIGTTPRAWSALHENRSNAQMKIQPRKRKVEEMSVRPTLMSSANIGTVRPTGGPNLSTGAMANMSSDYLSDTVARNNDQAASMKKGPDQEKTMVQRLSDLQNP